VEEALATWEKMEKDFSKWDAEVSDQPLRDPPSEKQLVRSYNAIETK
jgi:hypothetical protein